MPMESEFPISRGHDSRADQNGINMILPDTSDEVVLLICWLAITLLNLEGMPW
jgi:hypothetical protein